MSYQIQYSPEKNKNYPIKPREQSIRWYRVVVAAAILAAGIWIKQNGIPDQWIPGDPAVTRKAASCFVEQLREGETLETAVTVFCQQILDGADI